MKAARNPMTTVRAPQSGRYQKTGGKSLRAVDMEKYEDRSYISLSGGEKQRISIARAMMKDAPVIFLDEATANVDPENENDLMKAIQTLTEEKTVIMIAHRLKTVEHADQILVVDHGKIVQQGTHGNLMKEEGIYHNFISERREAASWKVKNQ